MRILVIIGSLIASLATVLLVASAFVLINGGLLYRVDCAQSDGSVTRSWHYTWTAPVPYVFGPSRSGCETHSGTRLALSALGVDHIPSQSAGDIAMRTATGPGDTYYATIYAVSADLVAAIRSGNRQQLLASLASGQRRLDGMAFPPSDLVDVDQRFRATYALFSRHVTRAGTVAESTAQATTNFASDIAALDGEMSEMQRIVIADR